MLCLAGCSSGDGQPQADAGAERIECALGGAEQFAQSCLVERVAVEGKGIVVVRHPDGSFRRFELVSDGRGLTSADGADELTTELKGQMLGVTVGADRYLFPATVRGSDETAN